MIPAIIPIATPKKAADLWQLLIRFRWWESIRWP